MAENCRYQLPLRRLPAVLAQWDGDAAQAIEHLEAALALAREISLPGEAWPIWGELGRLYGEQGAQEKARAAYGETAVSIKQLAATIDDEKLRGGFVAAKPVQAVLQQSKHISEM